VLERLFADVDPEVAHSIDHALSGKELSVARAERLLQAEGADLHALLRAADVARHEDVGDDISYVVCRNINFTNVCYVNCSFCGFARHRDEADSYDHPMEKLLEKCRNAVSRGATEVCIQGGIDPQKTPAHYREILEAIKGEFPNLHIHAYSPEELHFLDEKSDMPLKELLLWLKEAGLGTIPGTAAEILDDEIRQIISPRKLMTERWLEIVRTAHEVGLRSSSTLMYGHIEKPHHIAGHLGLLRDLQRETGGFTEFVPLGFIHDKNVLFNHLGARPGPSAAEDLRIIAVSRLFLRPWITNVQVSWVKLGPKLSQLGFQSGANDFGGTLMEESISRESGSDHGENLPQEEMRRLIREIGRVPVERGTKYQTLRRFDDPEKDPPSLEPAPEATELSGPTRWRLAEEQNRKRAGLKTAEH